MKGVALERPATKRLPRPLYEQLVPRRNASSRAVEAHQRARLHAAVIEACAEHGYGATTARELVTLAGVSTKALYKLFGSKDECFLEFLEQAHIKTICTRVQFSAGAGHGSECPAGSIYGHARAFTPLLDKPLEGPVYLRSSSHKLPDLVAALNGQIDVELAGRVDSGHNAGIRNTFEVVPDAPVSKFILAMKGGKKGLLVNSENLCSREAKREAIVRLAGQNGKVEAFKPTVANSCKRPGRRPGAKGKR